jgi:hypothetical protein
MHVPKSAGISVHAALESVLPAGSISPKRQDTTLLCGFSDVDELRDSIRSQLVVGVDEIEMLGNYPFVSGHFSLSTLLQITNASAIATVLREPRARLLSLYAFWRYSSGLRAAWSGYPPLDHVLRPLSEFLGEPRVAQATDNLVCRMLLPGDSRIPEQEFIAAEDVEDVAERATSVLETLGFVGVVELADQMWSGLSQFFAVPLVPLHAHRTADQSAGSDMDAADLRVTTATLNLIERRTAADSIVYRRILEQTGCSSDVTDLIRGAAFAAGLVMFGDVAGPSAAQARERARTIDELARRVQDASRLQDELVRIHQELVRTREELERHRAWLDAVRNSSSWRVTAPARAGAQTVRRLKARASGRC